MMILMFVESIFSQVNSLAYIFVELKEHSPSKDTDWGRVRIASSKTIIGEINLTVTSDRVLVIDRSKSTSIDVLYFLGALLLVSRVFSAITSPMLVVILIVSCVYCDGMKPNFKPEMVNVYGIPAEHWELLPSQTSKIIWEIDWG